MFSTRSSCKTARDPNVPHTVLKGSVSRLGRRWTGRETPAANADEQELITLFYGEDMPHTEANRIADVIRKKYSNQEVEVQQGGQSHYHFIISVE